MEWQLVRATVSQGEDKQLTLLYVAEYIDSIPAMLGVAVIRRHSESNGDSDMARTAGVRNILEDPQVN